MTTASIHHEEHLLLDPAIRDWVVFPMIAMVILVGIGRFYAQELLSVSVLFDIDIQKIKATNHYCIYYQGNRVLQILLQKS